MRKSFDKGIEQLAKEGTIQILRSLDGLEFFVAAVGRLQFDVLEFRLQSEYRVKVVVDRKWRALYFSRAPIPYDRDRKMAEGGNYLRHLGLYAYRQAFLQTFVQLPQGRLERIERLEQLRALENGYAIGVVEVPSAPLEVDCPEDLAAVRLELARQ